MDNAVVGEFYFTKQPDGSLKLSAVSVIDEAEGRQIEARLAASQQMLEFIELFLTYTDPRRHGVNNGFAAWHSVSASDMGELHGMAARALLAAQGER